jgi:putative transposase
MPEPNTEIHLDAVEQQLLEDLERPTPRKQKRARPADGSIRRHQAEHPHQVWAMDFQFDATADGRRLKFLNVIDEHSRLCLAIRVGRRCKAKDVVAVLEELTSLYPAPTFIRSDNGPEFIAHALRRWCKSSGMTTAYIEPGSPWQNGFAESFNSRFRDEFFNTELFVTVAEASSSCSIRVLLVWGPLSDTRKPSAARSALVSATFGGLGLERRAGM